MSGGLKAALSKKIDRLKTIPLYTPNKKLTLETLEWKLDANENHFLDKAFVKKILLEAAEECDARFYPAEEFEMLEEALSRWLGVGREQVAVGCGADQLIDFLIQAFAVGGRVTSIAPTFTVFSVRSMVLGASYVPVPLNSDLSLPRRELVEEASRSDIIFICSPNNPTANQFGREDVLSVVESAEGVVVVDEVYGDFADYSLVPDVGRYDNLVVLRSFSKSFGIAGMRVGYMVAPAELIGPFRSVLYTYGVPSLSLIMAAKMLKHVGEVREAIEKMKVEREWLIKRLSGFPVVKTFPSQANFIFLASGHGHALEKKLSQKGLMVKSLGETLGLGPCFRITVGRRQASERLISTLTELMQG